MSLLLIRSVCRNALRKTSHTNMRRVTTATPRTLELAEGVLRSDRAALARSITLAESTREVDHTQSQLLLNYVLKAPRTAADTFRLGVAGPPGAGKSTFVEALGTYLVGEGHRVAVIAIDPSSSRTGGSILGDKTRMNELSRHPNAYVRASPTSGMLGGVAQATNDVVLLCEAAAFDIIIVETVGLGQSEVQVDDAVDMLMLMVPPAGGDELQGVKKGIMEVADCVVVNKADGDLQNAARRAATEYTHALQFMRHKRKEWRPRVTRCSSLHQERIEKVWSIVKKFRSIMVGNGELEAKRQRQNQLWMMSELHGMLNKMVRHNDAVQIRANELCNELANKKISPRAAAADLVDVLFVSQCSESVEDSFEHEI